MKICGYENYNKRYVCKNKKCREDEQR